MSNLSRKIEAILYLKGQPLSVTKIAEYAQCDRPTAEEGLMELLADYAHRDSALEIAESADGYCLQLRDEFQDLVHALIPVDLGVGALRTLAAIALKGPISQTDLVELRGSGVYQHVPELVSLGFIRKRRQTDGRSYWLQITPKFYQYFQMDSLPKPFDTTQGSRSSESPEISNEATPTEMAMEDPAPIATGADLDAEEV